MNFKVSHSYLFPLIAARVWRLNKAFCNGARDLVVYFIERNLTAARATHLSLPTGGPTDAKLPLVKITCSEELLSLSITASLFFPAPSAPAAPWQTLSGHVPAAVAHLPPASRLPATNRLHLAIGLAPRNQAALEKLLQDQQDPKSPSYHHWLTLEQFTDQFGPTEQDYQKVVDFAQANGLKVTGRHPNRLILDVEGAVPDVENALHTTVRTYRHPTELRQFFAPDAEPSLDLEVPLLNITGLDNYTLPHPVSDRIPLPPHSSAHAQRVQRTRWLCARRPEERLCPGHDADWGRSERRARGVRHRIPGDGWLRKQRPHRLRERVWPAGHQCDDCAGCREHHLWGGKRPC